MNSRVCILLFLVATMALARGENFCPPPRDPSPCTLRSNWNDCCKQSDCHSFDICCAEPCGNVCRRATDKATTGVAFKDGEYCVEDHCPQPRDLSSCTLKYKRNDCCKQSDCRSTDVCCKEPCGNFCRRAIDRPVYGGVKVVDGERCTEGWQN